MQARQCVPESTTNLADPLLPHVDLGCDQSAPPGGVVLEVRATGVCRSDWHGWKSHDGDVIARAAVHARTRGEWRRSRARRGVQLPPSAPRRRAIHPLVRMLPRVRPRRATICEQRCCSGFTQPVTARSTSLSMADRRLRVLPDNVSFESNAALGCRFTTAFRAVVQQGRLRVGASSLGGPQLSAAGLSAVMVGAATGARRCSKSLDPSRAARDRALQLGASVAIDAYGGLSR